jgi:hypothetical protein
MILKFLMNNVWVLKNYWMNKIHWNSRQNRIKAKIIIVSIIKFKFNKTYFINKIKIKNRNNNIIFCKKIYLQKLLIKNR